MLRERAREPWNPSAALADRALDGGRLPYVKLDTLRFDPYGLGADKLLDYCEEQLPRRVRRRARVPRGDGACSTRRDRTEKLRPTPPALAPLRRQVEYRRAP